MNVHHCNFIFICLMFTLVPCSYGHNELESYNSIQSHADHAGNFYKASYQHWKSAMLSMWNAEETTLEDRLDYIFNQIHKNPINQTLIFYNYNLARSLFNKPEISVLEHFEAQFDMAWWYMIVDRFHVGCPCVYFACFSPTAQFASIIKEIHKNPGNQEIIFRSYNLARALFNKPEIHSLEQFDTQWWQNRINTFNLERQSLINNAQEQLRTSISVFAIEIAALTLLTIVLFKVSNLPAFSPLNAFREANIPIPLQPIAAPAA